MDIKEMPFYRPTAEALRLKSKEVVGMIISSNFGVKSSFHRVHDCQQTLHQATERRKFDFDTAYGLLYLAGFRPQVLETADGFVFLLLPSGKYDKTISLEVAMQEARVYLARLLKVDENIKSSLKMLAVFRGDMDIIRGQNVPRDKILFEFRRHENVA